jgi:hypothetical protein
MRIVASVRLIEAANVPSGEKETLRIPPSCPDRRTISLPVLALFCELRLRKSQADALLRQLARHWQHEFDTLCQLLAKSDEAGQRTANGRGVGCDSS